MNLNQPPRGGRASACQFNPQPRCLRGAVGVSLLAMLLCAGTASAQWMTQSLSLKAGWNAVYLHVDPSHKALTNLVGSDLSNPILEVWLWAPAVSTVQFVQSPQEPIASNSQWRNWVRNTGEGTLTRLVGNAAYLIKVATNVPNYTWTIQGKPLPPTYDWTTTGLNFFGFPSVPDSPPTWENFLAKAPELQLNAEVYFYQGGELGAGNPTRLYAYRTARVTRGQAYWIRSGTLFNRYFAPFEVALSGNSGVNFGDTLSASSFRLRNLTSTNVTVSLNLVPSETPPLGQTNIAGLPPLLVRGALNTTTLTYSYTNLAAGTPRAWTLPPQGQPGSDVEVVLGLNRAAMTGNEGEFFAAVLRLTDSLGFSQVDMPVTANVASSTGLWVGEASVTQVGQYLVNYRKNSAGVIELNEDGTYGRFPTSTNKTEVPRSFPLRLIVHNPTNGGNAVLLQHVFYGRDATTNVVVTTSEAALNRTFLSDARRISASHLPWTATNHFWTFSGRLGESTNLTVTVSLPYQDQASNPFLHTYHPDHDNLDATFKSELPQGMESYSMSREISLIVQPPSEDFFSLTGSRQRLAGIYQETIRLSGLARAGGTNDTRLFQVQGVFTLNRISDVPFLTLTSTP